MTPELLELLQVAIGITGLSQFSENGSGNCRDCCQAEAYGRSECYFASSVALGVLAATRSLDMAERTKMGMMK